MYVPEKFKVEDQHEIYAFIQKYPFALLLTIDDEDIHDTHTPFILSEKDGYLYGHIARANPQWKHWTVETKAKVIFSGPHCYVSPNDYASDFNVPTWNYTAVSVSGKIKIIESEAEILTFLDLLTEANETAQTPWKLDHTDERYRKLLSGIVVFKVEINNIDATFKLNQNKATEDQHSVINALERRICPFNQAVAEVMKRQINDDL